MGCINCGRGLHKTCARTRSSVQCCGETSLCGSLTRSTDSKTKLGSSDAIKSERYRAATSSASETPSPTQPKEPRSSNDSITTVDLDHGTEENRRYRTYKNEDELRDAESTGRKRAAQLFPLDRNADCEWRGSANCGGGRYPIVGCLDGKQTNRHHGPDKSTTNNNEGNVHRICARCHNLWHEWNDADPKPDILHDPREATPEELAIWNSKLRPKAPNSRRKMHMERHKNGSD